MPILSTRCPVLDVRVTRIVDFDGETTRIICPDYDEATAACRVQQRMFEGGRLSQLLARVDGLTLDTRSTRCVLRPAA